MSEHRAALYARIRQNGGVLDLSSRTKLYLKGDDRVRYLNGQVTNDVRKCDRQVALYACVLSAKGKLSADVFISAAEHSLRVDAATEVREILAARLERYIISDDVVIEDATETEGLLHVLGGVDFKPRVPPPLMAFRSNRLGFDGLDIVGDNRVVQGFLPTLQQDLVTIDDAMAEVIRIERGVPKWSCELDENTFPAEAGLEQSAIDFEKGCYIGQEVVSRLRSVGHVNRQLWGIIAAEGATLERGMRLVSAVDQAPIGGITSATFSFALEKWVALGYVKRGRIASAVEALGSTNASGPNSEKVTLTELPFIS